jgi:hypothetical protein
MDLIADQYDANDSALRRTVERIKDALDPAGIHAPGKQGIWPARRADRAHIAPTEEPFLDITNRASSMLFALIRGFDPHGARRCGVRARLMLDTCFG